MKETSASPALKFFKKEPSPMPKDATKINLTRLFNSLQKQMETRFETARGSVPHAGTLGAAAEQNWLALLNAYLPARYRADSAFVVDHRGNLSLQIDVVIYDRQYSPLLFHQDNALYVPAESVYAVFDSKHQLTSRTIKESAEKAASVRRLYRTSVPVKFVAGTYKRKPLFDLLAGVLAPEASWAEGVGLSLAWELDRLAPDAQLQLGCAVHHGAFEAEYFQNRGVKLQVSNPEDALIFFFVRLLNRLQQLGTVPAIDILKYAGNLETKTVRGKQPK
jgi:hypothetical protein